MDWLHRLRLLAIPTLCAFLSFVFVVIRPWSKIAGQWAFLVYTSNLIFFFPRGRISVQLEATVLGTIGGVLGVVWSTGTLALAAWCGRKYGADSSQSRAILGLSLALLALIVGFIRSVSRRLNAFSKIAIFFPIFMLTSQQSITHLTPAHFLQQFYVVIFSAIFALLPTLLLAPHQSHNQIGVQIDNAVKTINSLLPLSISNLLDVDHPLTQHKHHLRHSGANVGPGKSLEGEAETAELPSQDKLAKQLKGIVANLHISSTSYIRDSRLLERQSTSLLSVIKALQKLQRNPLLGQTSHAPGERIQAALQKSFPPSRPNSVVGTPKHRRSISLSRHRSRASLSSEREASTENTWPRHKLRHLTSNFGRPSESHKSIPLDTKPDLKDASQHLVQAIVEALQLVNLTLAEKFHWPGSNKSETAKTREELFDARVNLEDVLTEVQRALGTLLSGSEKGLNQDVVVDDLRQTQSTSSELPLTANQSQPHVSFSESPDVTNLLKNKDRFRLAFYMTALLDLARDVHGITNTVIEMSAGEITPFSWMAIFRLGWMRHDKDEEDENAQDGQPPNETDLVMEEEQPNDVTKEYQDMDFVTATLYQRRSLVQEHGDMRDSFSRFWRRGWDQHGVVKARIMLSRLFHQLKHSRHVLFSLKMALGISLLSLPAFLPADHAGRKWYDTSRGGWMVVSYMFVLEDTTGAILKVGFLRGLGCFIGAVMGYVCAIIAHENPYALVVLATACTIPISWHILFNTSTPGLGVSTGITLPPLLFITYLNESHGQSYFTLAWYRFTDIIIGTFAAVLFGSFVWPVHARVQYFRAVGGTMERITEFYLRMSRDLVRSSLVYRIDDKQYDDLEAKIKREFALSRTLISIQKQEISLLPRPVKLYSEIIDAIERLLETLVEIRLLRFSVPRKATVLDVLPIRRELISTILINLWACAHSFHSRSPLPQFLPTPRSPLSELMEVTDQHARDIRAFRNTFGEDIRGRNRSHSPSPINMNRSSSAQGEGQVDYQAEMAILYAMAENEALGEVCNILEEIVAAAKTLFGTQTFLDTN
ncbi:hypothetical protein I302_102972 [Kwoniella bestiolae CBS 10118]|uniref:Integral membrane bound transporter domain-containing protein n=1 Tax=Kwoniella bestiolae CBS 10118 TaxID=1296100 RepID=A0A1B9GGI0_9TREE|nr:hypothetical protein I302_01668 [Kwoniella bestiolae CBS 10118]OCF30149.1 hypothetical protein I302_01668 [Kwoniella bestiolae CBS 10118]